MSYTLEIKKELVLLPVKRPCCRRSFSYGLLSGAVDAGDGVIRMRFHSLEMAKDVESIMAPVWKGDSWILETVVGKNRYEDLCVASPLAAEEYRAYENGELETEVPPSCPNCLYSFFRGAFLTCGTVNSPDEASHLEFRVKDSFVEAFRARLESLDLTPGTVKRKNVTGVYLKSSQQIQDLLGMLGDTKHTFEYINTKLLREARREDHAITNYEIGNLQKAVNASMEDINAIETIKASGRFSSLSEELQYTAELRLSNPEATLRELAKMHNPGVSVSGLCHRMKHLRELAEELKS